MSPAQTAVSRRRRLRWWLLVAAFVVVPMVEIFVLIQVGQVIGPWWTIGLLILDSIFGGWLVKHEGARAWRALTTALNSGRMPATELADGALILIGGTLMLTPGFVTDIVGILLILPFTRPVCRHILARVVSRKLVGGAVAGASTWTVGGVRAPGAGTNPPGDGSVVQGVVVDDDRS